MSRLEKITNIAILVTCVLIAAMLARNFYMGRQSDPRSQLSVAKGQVIKLPGYAPPNPQPVLVLALSKRCHFCQDSVPFYQRLVAFRNSSPQGLRLVAVLPESKDEASAYLKEERIEVDAVLSFPLQQIGVRGTPTVLLLNGQNKLEEFWVGKLTNSQESDVWETLRKTCALCSVPAAAGMITPN